MQVINQLFEEITNEYSLQILKWAYKKCGDGYRAEELTQEVFTQIFTAIQKNEEAGKTIKQMEHFIWRIAHYVWCHSLRGSARFVMCSMEENIGDESDFVSDLADQEEQTLLLTELRKQISRLNYLQREILVSFYIDGLPQKTIANRLGISESVVKWHLHDTRRKLKKELTENMDKQREQEYIYRPKRLHMAICGEAISHPDTKEVKGSLTRQNICIACYQHPKSLDELTALLGIPKVYLEFDLNWLEEHEFVTFEKGKYYTTFYINSRSEMQKSYGIHCGLKEQVSDVIVNGLLEAEDTIRRICFHGSDVPMDKLLWYLIYVFCKYFQDNNKDDSIWMDKPIRPDGGSYYPLGFIEDEEDITEWVLDNRGFAYRGDMIFYSFRWFGLYNFGYSEIVDLLARFTPEWANLHVLLVDIIKADFDISWITEDRKFDLAKLVEKGFVEIKGDQAIPSFAVFTEEQFNRLEREVFEPIVEKLRPGYEVLKEELTKFYQDKLPKQLGSIHKLPLRQALYDMGYVTTVLAFKEGKLYVPKDRADGEFLTLLYVKEE